MSGTFLVRSGILNSIHTFANDPAHFNEFQEINAVQYSKKRNFLVIFKSIENLMDLNHRVVDFYYTIRSNRLYYFLI